MADYPVTLPHFNKILARQLFHQAQHFQLEERGDEFGRRGIFHLFKQIVQVYGDIHLQGSEQPAGYGAQFRGRPLIRMLPRRYRMQPVPARIRLPPSIY